MGECEPFCSVLARLAVSRAGADGPCPRGREACRLMCMPARGVLGSLVSVLLPGVRIERLSLRASCCRAFGWRWQLLLVWLGTGCRCAFSENSLVAVHSPRRWSCGPFNAHVNPTGGSVGGVPTVPPQGPSCAATGRQYHLWGPGATSTALCSPTGPGNTGGGGVTPCGAQVPRALRCVRIGKRGGSSGRMWPR